MNYLGQLTIEALDESEMLEEELKAIEENGLAGLVDFYNLKYSGKPEFKMAITKQFNRPSALKKALVNKMGADCKICKKQGFKMKNGSEYCELHHMIEINSQAPKTLQSWNTLILCPNCHRQMHYGDVSTKFLNPGWEVRIDDVTHQIF